MKLIPIQFDINSLQRYSRLLISAFPKTSLNAKKFSVESLTWLYTLNPEGHAIGFDAIDEGLLISHYVCIPTVISCRSVHVKALLSLNTATATDYQGQGLFTKLAKLTYGVAKELGFCCVYGVANKNSTPGFINKLDFNFVGQLDVFVGFERITDPISNLEFKRIWSADTLSWRCSNPANPIVRLSSKSSNLFFAKTGYPYINVYDEKNDGSANDEPKYRKNLGIKLLLGFYPQGVPFTFVKIPNLLKPAPLNFIFKSLLPTCRVPDKRKIHFTFLDFDAY